MDLRANYEYPVLITLILTMLVVRFRGINELVTPIKFRGVDAYYHYKASLYTVEHYPNPLQFDPYTNFPYGKSTGQFGTIYDQVIATVSLLFGGSPETTGYVLILAPVIVGTLTILPVYSIGTTLSNRIGGLFAALILAFQPGVFLQKSMAGHSDHNIVEVFLLACSLAFLLKAIDSDSKVYSVIAGVFTGIYLLVWPPGILLIAIYSAGIAISYLVLLTYSRPIEPLYRITFYTFGTAALVTLLHDPIRTFEVTQQSLLQPYAALTPVILGMVAAIISMFTSGKRAGGTLASIYAIGGIIASYSILYLYPSVWRFIHDFLLFGMSIDSSISETAPFPAVYVANYGVTNLQALHLMYGFSAFTALLGLGLYISRNGAIGSNWNSIATNWILITLSVVLTCAAFTQIRFNYYLVIPVAIFNGYLFSTVVSTIGTTSRERVTAVALVGLLISGSLLLPLAQTDYGGVDDSLDEWKPALEYVQENTTHPELSYTYTEDYDYPNGSFGVLSWWDYGHWISLYAERPTVSNPFQDNRGITSRILLSPQGETNQLLEQVSDENASVEYIVLDKSMLNRSQTLHAIVSVHPQVNHSTLYRDGNYTHRYRESFIYRLWHNQTNWTTTYRTQTVRIYRRS